MKIGIISDIHSNITALERVFEEFKKKGIEKVICVGDIIGIGPYSEKCIQFLMERRHMILACIRGNHENYLMRGLPLRKHNISTARLLTEEDKSTHRWNHNRLNDEHREFIKELNDREEIEVEGKKIVIEHYPMDSKGTFKLFYREPEEEKTCELFENKDADIYMYGHTHRQVYFVKNNKHYINPGSVGCPRRTQAACFGILEIENDEINYEACKAEYNIEQTIEEIRELEYPLNEYMIERFYL